MKTALSFIILTISFNSFAGVNCKNVAISAAIKHLKSMPGICKSKPRVEDYDLVEVTQVTPTLEIEHWAITLESNCPGWITYAVSVKHNQKGCKVDEISVLAEE